MVPYVEARDQGLLYIAGTRIPLAAIAHGFRQGESPEAIRRSFPVLSLEQVYGAITYCLAHPQEVKRYMARLAALEEEAARSAPPLPGELRRKLAAASGGRPATPLGKVSREIEHVPR